MVCMGQCFLIFMDIVGFVISEEIFYDDVYDVKIDDQKYCFFDGIGRILEELVVEVCI